MYKVYTITLHVTASEDLNVADYMANRCRSHFSFRGGCPVGEMNCPFRDRKSCKEIWGEDWEPLFTDTGVRHE